MKLPLLFVTGLVLIPFSRASSNLSLSPTALVQSYFPCDSLLLRRSPWQAAYYESSILPESEQGITDDEFYRFTDRFGAKCGAKLQGTNHTLLCSRQAFILVPPKKPRNALVFMHGVQRREEVANYLPFFSRLLANEPELTSTLQVEHPLAPLRRITVGDFTSPPLRIGRAWIDILSLPNDDPQPPPCNVCTAEDRLGLYRTTELIDVIIRSQFCKLSIPSNRVLLVGHSLGALATLEAVMATDLPLAGAIALSGVLPRAGDYIIPDVKAYNVAERKYTVTMIHGTDDDILPFPLGNASAQIVKRVMNSTGGGFRFKAIQGEDHFMTFFQSPVLYETIRDALREAF